MKKNWYYIDFADKANNTVIFWTLFNYSKRKKKTKKDTSISIISETVLRKPTVTFNIYYTDHYMQWLSIIAVFSRKTI